MKTPAVGSTPAGCSTPFGITEVGIGTVSSSTTALTGSAQRLSASQRWAWDSLKVDVGHVNECSTPFGITEVGIVLHADRHPEFRHVLNAFRHHRGGHEPGQVDQLFRVQCSTPFGITEVGIGV